VELEAQLHVALDNMPGALVYTDEALNIIICNERFKEMYRAPRELLEPGQPYPNFPRYLAEHGYYGEGDVEALVAKRVESLRNPSGGTFEDMTPDRRVYRIRRQRVAAGGTVTVMTDVTEQKQAERDLMQERDGLRVLIDLTKQDKSEMIAVLEEVLSQLKN
jgi:PAS domain-containing protein